MLIPVLSEGRYVMDYIECTTNLTSHSTPAYMNEGGELGLARTDDDVLVIIYSNEYCPGSSFAEKITENDAYQLCMEKNHVELIDELDITPTIEY